MGLKTGLTTVFGGISRDVRALAGGELAGGERRPVRDTDSERVVALRVNEREYMEPENESNPPVVIMVVEYKREDKSKDLPFAPRSIVNDKESHVTCHTTQVKKLEAWA